jgi:hypothetical protein
MDILVKRGYGCICVFILLSIVSKKVCVLLKVKHNRVDILRRFKGVYGRVYCVNGMFFNKLWNCCIIEVSCDEVK